MTTLWLAMAGGLIGMIVACLPGVHVYQVMGLIFLWGTAALTEVFGGSAWMLPVVTGLLVGYAGLGAVPSVLASAPDDSAFFTVLPGQRLLMEGRGYEAIFLTIAGSLAGLVGVVVVFGLIGPRLLPLVRTVLSPHFHWLLWLTVLFMLMSEWPRELAPMQGGWRRLLTAWRSLGMGLVTFGLSGWLGFILLFRHPGGAERAFMGLGPALMGLFAIPGLLLNLVSRTRIPPQPCLAMPVPPVDTWWRAIAAGMLGGGIGAFLPVVTGGVGALLAGHTMGHRDSRGFLISQGAARMVYYAGGFLFLVMPGLGMVRGGAAGMVRTFGWIPGPVDYLQVLGALCMSGALLALIPAPMVRGMMTLTLRIGLRRLSVGGLVLLGILIAVSSGWPGIRVAVVAAGIGLIPPLFGTRRMNALGVLLIPLGCRLSGVDGRVAEWLGLL